MTHPMSWTSPAPSVACLHAHSLLDHLHTHPCPQLIPPTPTCLHAHSYPSFGPLHTCTNPTPPSPLIFAFCLLAHTQTRHLSPPVSTSGVISPTRAYSPLPTKGVSFMPVCHWLSYREEGTLDGTQTGTCSGTDSLVQVHKLCGGQGKGRKCWIPSFFSF